MKRTLHTIAAIAAVFAGFLPAAQAQSPTITANQLPKVGDKQVHYTADTTGVMPGAKGANQTWDFSSITPTGDSIVTNIIAPSSTPHAADYPSATVAANSVSGGAIMYMDLSAGNNVVLGFVAEQQGQTIKQKYTNTLVQFTTPISFNYTHNDTYSGGFNVSGMDAYTNGTINVEADAYGTVLMPGGKTYANVIRLHSMQRNTDSFDLGPSSMSILTTSESYSFVQEGRMDPVLTITYSSQETVQGTVTSKSVTFNNSAASVSNINGPGFYGKNSSFSIFPNPSATRAINVVTTSQKTGVCNIHVLNQLGQIVKSFNNLNSSEGTNNFNIGLEELPKGMYMVQVQTNAGASVQKLILE